jgi:peptide/nickel transport system substrate-binding protein
MRYQIFGGALRRWRKRSSLAALCLFAAVSTAGVPGCPPPSPELQEPATLRLGSRDARDARAVLTRFLYAERLIAIGWNGRPQQALATEWHWLDDGKALEINLRKGVTFHDGTALTASLVADILKKIKASDKRNSLGAASRFEAKGDHTLVVHLSHPDAFFVEAIADTLVVDPDKPDIGTGPFKILTRAPSIVAEKYPAYYQGLPGIDKVEVISYETPRAAWVALMRGEVDMLQQVNRDSAEFLEGVTHVEMSSTIVPYYIPLVFNVRHPVLRRVEVRRALAEAVNREEIVREAMGGHGRVADDPVWPFHWTYNNAARKYTYNPSAARVRLDAAGFPMHSSSVPGGMASRFSLRCAFWSEPQFERIALILQRQLADVGIDLVLEALDDAALQRRVGKGDFDTYLYQLASGKSFDWTYRFWHSPADGAAAYQNSGYTGVDSVLDRLRVVLPDADVRTAVADLRQRFFEDAPAAFLAWPETTRAIDARFDIGDRTDPDVFANLWKWRQRQNQSASK